MTANVSAVNTHLKRQAMFSNRYTANTESTVSDCKTVTL